MRDLGDGTQIQAQISLCFLYALCIKTENNLVFLLILPKQFWGVGFSTCGHIDSQEVLNSRVFEFYISKSGMLSLYGQYEVQKLGRSF